MSRITRSRIPVFLAAASCYGAWSAPGFLHRNSPTSARYLVETMAGGVALLDFDGDGLLDIFLVNGGLLHDPHRKASFARADPRFWNRLYRQRSDRSWQDVTERAGLHRAGDENYGMGAAVGDFDNDGHPDLYVTNFGRNQLWRNNGDGTFQDVTAFAGVSAGGWSVSAAFLDYDRDGLLDLFVVRYLDYTIAANRICGHPAHSYCRPSYYPRITNILYRNIGGGRFEDVSERTGIRQYFGAGMGVAIADLNSDGWPDIFVANDSMEQWLFENVEGKRFAERGLEAGVAFSGDGKPFAGMGAAIADYDNDGKFDVAVTNLALEKFALFRSLGGGLFEYATARTGLAALTVRHSGWGLAWMDYDNDGHRDLIVAQSHVLDNVAELRAGLFYREPPALYRNTAGRFAKLLLGADPVAGRGLATGDLDNDGTIETVISVLGGSPLILPAAKTANNWLGVKLIGTASPRDGQGATVRAGDQTIVATTAGSYLSASDSRVHIGLGRKAQTDLTIEWPSGRRQELKDVAANRWIEVRER